MSIVVDAWFTANEYVLSACVLVSKYFVLYSLFIIIMFALDFVGSESSTA
jgi:hypothetical protein